MAYRAGSLSVAVPGNRAMLEIAVDIGGTFTDLVAYDRSSGRLYVAKTSTTPDDLSTGIAACLDRSECSVVDAVRFVHGSTVAINTVIERAGAPTALVVTRGTRDVYAIGRGNRPDAYDVHFKRPVPLVPRHLTFEVDERLAPTGEVWQPFDEAQARAIAQAVASSGVQAVAVCFLHAWCNPVHEQRMGALLAEACPNAFITLSHEILREYGEYERMSTTAINAYIGPRVRAYLERLHGLLDRLGFGGRLVIMQSNGGVMTPAVARRRPVAMLESGPVGGFLAAASIGTRVGYPRVIGFDMGGTTAKTCLIEDGEPRMAHGYHVGGYAQGQPVMLPVVDTVEVGSGGGSIAWVDRAGVLHVGPRSAGADPGPACYSRGGTSATVTDANLVLGRLGERALLGGEMRLDAAAAASAVRNTVADPLRLDVVDAARAITKIAVLKMSLAVREVSVERGYDPRDFALVAFGGAGPLHAVEVARELHIPTVIVPVVPGQLSAAGMLGADVKHDYVRTYYDDLARIDVRHLADVIEELVERGRQQLIEEDVPPSAMSFRRLLEVRYAGQEFTLPVGVDTGDPTDDPRARFRADFQAVHERQFGYHDTDRALEIVNVRVVAVGRRPQSPDLRMAPALDAVPTTTRRLVYFNASEQAVETSVLSRDHLPVGTTVDGPAVIQEYGSTTILFPGDRAHVVSSGEILISVAEPSA